MSIKQIYRKLLWEYEPSHYDPQWAGQFKYLKERLFNEILYHHKGDMNKISTELGVDKDLLHKMFGWEQDLKLKLDKMIYKREVETEEDRDKKWERLLQHLENNHG